MRTDACTRFSQSYVRAQGPEIGAMFALADRLRVPSSSARCMRRWLSHAPNRIDHRRSSARRQQRSSRPKANHRVNSIRSRAFHVMPWRPPFPNSRDGIFPIAWLHGAASVCVGQRRNRTFGSCIFTSDGFRISASDCAAQRPARTHPKPARLCVFTECRGAPSRYQVIVRNRCGSDSHA
jgi:hypothetical protein